MSILGISYDVIFFGKYIYSVLKIYHVIICENTASIRDDSFKGLIGWVLQWFSIIHCDSSHCVCYDCVPLAAYLRIFVHLLYIRKSKSSKFSVCVTWQEWKVSRIILSVFCQFVYHILLSWVLQVIGSKIVKKLKDMSMSNFNFCVKLSMYV